MALIAYSVLFFTGLTTTLSEYGLIYLLAYFPLMMMWGFFWGTPAIIASLRVRDAFTQTEIIRVILAQTLLLAFLFAIVANLGIQKILPMVLLTGVVTGLTMPATSLRKERAESRGGERGK